MVGTLSHVNPCVHFNQPSLYPLGLASAKYMTYTWQEDTLVHPVLGAKQLVPIQQVSSFNFYVVQIQFYWLSAFYLRKWWAAAKRSHANKVTTWTTDSPLWCPLCLQPQVCESSGVKWGHALLTFYCVSSQSYRQFRAVRRIQHSVSQICFLGTAFTQRSTIR